MPPLRERKADLPAIVDEMIARNVSEGRERIAFAPQALAALTDYAWPGNVRELGNLIERLTILAGGRTLGIDDLPARYRPADWVAEPKPAAQDEPDSPPIPDLEVLRLLEAGTLEAGVAELPPAGIDLRSHLDDIERRLIEQALERSSGTVAHAARLLGLRRTTLVEKLRKLGEAGERAGSLTLDAPSCAL